MKKELIYILALVAIGTSCSNEVETRDEPKVYQELVLTSSEQQTMAQLKDFGTGYINAAAGTVKDGENMCISPLSAYLGLAMVAQGLENDKANELTALLGSQSIDDLNSTAGKLMAYLCQPYGEDQLSVANNIWLQKGVKVNAGYFETMSKYYNAAIQNVNFIETQKTRSLINSWISDRTWNMIPEFVKEEDLNPATMFYFANTIAYNGKWDVRFNPKDTKEETFNSVKGPQKCMMMHNKARNETGVFDDSDWIHLTLSHDMTDLFIIIPKGATPRQFLATLDKNTIHERYLSMQTYIVNLSMPRFDLNHKSNCTDILSAMGLELEGALSGISPDLAGTNLGKIKQETVLNVSEEGVKAVAVTGGGGDMSSFVPYKTDFRVDEPFAYIIRDSKTGMIIMAGVVNSLD